MSTVLLLAVCLTASHFMVPVNALLLLLFVLAGMLTERGATVYDRGRFELGLAAQASGLLLGGYLLFAERQSLFATWVQGIGAFFIGLLLSAAIASLLAKAASTRK